MDLNTFWEFCVTCTENVYQDKSALLRSATFALIPDHHLPLSYDMTDHQIEFNETFAKEVIRALDIRDRLLIMHKGIHECMHAISFRKVKKQGGGAGHYDLGLGQTIVINGQKKRHNYLLNEYMTDYLAFDVMQKTLNPMVAGWENEMHVRIILKIASIVSMKILKNAYFDGRFNEFIKRLDKKRGNSKEILATLGHDNKIPTDEDLQKAFAIL